MSHIPSTLVENSIRKKVAGDPGVGAGNFLRTAISISPDKNAPIISLERPFIDGGKKSFLHLSLNDLEHQSNSYASWYQQNGIKPGDLVAVYLDDGVEYFIHYLALTRIGAVAVLTNGNMEPEIAARHISRVKCVGIITDFAHRDRIALHLEKCVELKFFNTHDSIQFSDKNRHFVPYYLHDDADPIMIAHSSGTTGIPKAVLLEHGKFFYGIRSRLSVPRPEGGEKILSSLPHSHNCAMAYITLALLSGTPVFIASEHSGANIFRLIKSEQPTMVVSFPQSYVELTECDLDSDPLASVNLWFNGGDAAHESHIRRLIAKGTHHNGTEIVSGSIFVDGMGSSEMGFSLFKNIHTLTTDRYRRCVGKPLDWVKAAIFGEDGKPLAPGAIGRLAVKAPSVTTGYWNDSNLTTKSRISGYFLTGDLAYRDEDGFFYHVDRTPDAIQTHNGVVYSLWTEETILRHLPEISDCSVVGEKVGLNGLTQAVVIVRPRPDTNLNSDILLAAINSVLTTEQMNPVGKVIVKVKPIPLGTTGKVLKRVIRESMDQIAQL